eukprot:53170_1
MLNEWQWFENTLYLVFCITGIILSRYLLIKVVRKYYGLPTVGPVGLPMFGCLFSLTHNPNKLLKYCGDKYDICTMTLGNKDVIVVNSIDLYKKTNIGTQLNEDRPLFNTSLTLYPSFAFDLNGQKWKT